MKFDGLLSFFYQGRTEKARFDVDQFVRDAFAGITDSRNGGFVERVGHVDNLSLNICPSLLSLFPRFCIIVTPLLNVAHAVEVK